MTITTQTSADRTTQASFDSAGYSSEKRCNGQALGRPVSILSGALLAAYGLARRDWTGLFLAATGGALIYRGIERSSAAAPGKVRVAFTIGRSPDEVYSYVRDPQNWGRFQRGLKMRQLGERTIELSLARGEASPVASQIEITDEIAGKHIAWGSLDGPLTHRGVVHFRSTPGDRGTEVAVALEFKNPTGAIARGVAMLAGWHPEQIVRECLRHLKELMEAGEIPTTAGQPAGARGAKGAALRVLYRETGVERKANETGAAEFSASPRLAGD